ncbi:MAG: GNAT family N-acetyltransferase [Chloroflexi bacterium]|nr:GNAT family N-acetyltransferase [Chloroflexota bacterium]
MASDLQSTLSGAKRSGTQSKGAIRVATPDDLATICAQRRAMFDDMRVGTPSELDAGDVAFKSWVVNRIATGEYRGWFALNARDEIIAGAGLWIATMPPGPRDHTERRGYVMNVYTHPDYRQRGLARRLMNVIMEWCRANQIRTMMLHASDKGRALYESLGFKQTNEMRIKLRGDA